MRKTWIWIFVIAAIIIAVRVALPFLIKDYVNKTLNNLEGYNGSVHDIDLWIIKGAYVIDSLTIVKENDSIPVPFVIIPRMDLSVEWKALFDGAIVGEIELIKPAVNFAKAGKEQKQDGSEGNWIETMKELMPLRINQFKVTQGTVRYHDFTTSPEVDIELNQLILLVENISNVVSKDKELPSSFTASGTTNGGGNLNVNGKFNFLKDIPDLDLDFELENVDMTALNDFIKAYTYTDVESGTFNLYSEIVVDDAVLTGYVKPVINNLKVVDLKKEEGGFLEKAWETIVGGLTELFENQKKDQLATQVPLKGNLNDMNVGIVPAVWNIFKNAFIEAFSKRVEGTIDFSGDSN